MIKNKIFSFVFLAIQLTYSQAVQKSVLEVPEVERFNFYLDAVASLKISTHQEETIYISIVSEGEYKNEMYITHELNGNTFVLKSYVEALLADGFDKLSAMKVFSVQIEVLIPENKRVFVASSSLSLTASGTFYALDATLKEGSITLSPFLGNAYLTTFNGSIFITTADAKIDASTRSGKLKLPQFNYENKFIEIKTINGDIIVEKIE